MSATFIFAGLLFLFFLSQPIDLVKISKKDFIAWEILQANRINVVQELQSCFIARMERDLLAILDKNHISYSLLDRDIKGREYFLVYSPPLEPLDLEWLRQVGHVEALEKETLLFWTEEGDPSLLVPPEFKRKPLSSESILPYIQAPSEIPPERIYERKENDLVKQIVSEVSADRLRYLVQSLQDFVTRYTSTPNCEASGDFIFNYFKSLGLETSFQSFVFRDTYTSRNVIAEIRGRAYPEDVLIICAHYDSVSNTPAILAPGADDNASGTAAVLEAANVLVNCPLDFTVRFIAFSAEEWGLYGSKAYASLAKSKNERIIGVINMDMIAYADSMPEDLEIIVNPASEWLAEKTRLSSETYVFLGIRKTVSSSFVYSDHSSFWEKGYHALCGIEDNPVRNPYYHKISDTVDTLNFEFYTASTKVGLAILAELAQPIKVGYPRTPTGLTAKSTLLSSLFNTVKNVTLSWVPNPDAVGYDIYRTGMPHVYYKKINSAPIMGVSFVDRNLKPELSYFYAITTVGGGGLESNLSREAVVLPNTPSSMAEEKGNSFLLLKVGKQ